MEQPIQDNGQERPNEIGAGEAEVMSTEQHGLLEVTEGETISQGVPEAVIQPFHRNRAIFPTSMENYEPLERSYLIASFDLVEGGSQVIYPWRALMSSGRMPSRIIRKFDYFRSDITLKLQMVSSATTYGVVLGHMVPQEVDTRACYPVYENNDVRFWKTWSGNSGFTMAIADQETVEFNYPWTTPEHSFKISNSDTPVKLNALGRLIVQAPFVKNITPGITSPSVSIQVYASFKNVALMGPRSTLTPDYGQPFAKGMTSRTFRSAWKSHGDSANVNVADAQMEMVSAALSGIAIATEATVAVVDLIQGVQQVKDDGMKLLDKHQPEQLGLHPMLQDPGQANQRSGVKQSVYGDISSLYTNNSHANLGDHDNIVTPSPEFVVESAVGHNLYAMAQRWWVEKIFLNFGVTGERIFTLAVHPAPGAIIGTENSPETVDYGYLSTVARYYRFARGCIDYRLQFFASDLITMRVQVSIHFSADALGSESPTPEQLEEQAGDILSKTFTVRGTTTVEFTVPFIRGHDWEPINDFSNCAYVTVSVIDIVPSLVDGIEVGVPLLVSMRANKNFQWSSFTGGILNGEREESIPIADAQGFVNGDNATSEQITIFDGTVPPPTVLDFRGSSGNIYNLLKRASEADRNSAPVGTLPGRYGLSVSEDPAVWASAYNNSRLLDKFAAFFTWFTGSIRHKLYFKEFGTIDTLSVTMENPVLGATVPDVFRYRPEFGQHATEATVWPILEFEVPFLSKYTAAFTFLQAAAPVPPVEDPLKAILHDSSGLDVQAPDRHFVTIGDDFQFFLAVPPPTLQDPILREGKHFFTDPPISSFLEADAQSDLVTTVSVVDATYQLVDLNGGATVQGPTLSAFPVGLLSTQAVTTGWFDNTSAYTGNITISATTLNGSLDLGAITISVTQGQLLPFSFTGSFPEAEVHTLGRILLNIADPGGGSSARITATTCFMRTVGGGGGAGSILAGYTADYPLWVSEVRPPQEAPPPGEDFVISGTNLTNPVWISKVRPSQSNIGPVRGRAVSNLPPLGLSSALRDIYEDTGISFTNTTHTVIRDDMVTSTKHSFS